MVHSATLKKTKIMATAPITFWHIEGEDTEAVTDFTFLGSMITMNGDSSHQIKIPASLEESDEKPRQHLKK